MSGVLHLLKPDSPPLAAPIIEAMRSEANAHVTVVLLPGVVTPALPPGVTVRHLAAGDLDYAGLLDLIFEADRIIGW